jgi:radical SAM protein with 4Fe4S-binding SPASM domain
VVDGRLGRAARAAALAAAEDWRVLGRQLRVVFGAGRTRPGLYAYTRGKAPDRVRLHLRVQTDGAGLLFVNVNDVVHLSASAVEIARMLLDGVPAAEAARLLRRWHPEAGEATISGDVAAVARVVEHLSRPRSGCPTCELDLAMRPVFSQRAAAPYKADLAVTYACNNACGHCYNEPGRRGMAALDTAGWKQALARLRRVGVPHVIFTGGEATLREDLPALVAQASRLGLVAGLNTNGRRLGEPGYAARLAAAGLDHVQVTVASHHPAVHDRTVCAAAFEETVAGVRQSLAAGLHVITNTTLTRENQVQILETVDFLGGLGVRTFAMNGMICSGRGRDHADALGEAELSDILVRVRDHAAVRGLRFLWYTPTEYCRLNPLALGLGPKACNAAEYSICVEPDGSVLPCQSYYQPCGNLLRDDWESIWHSPLFEAIRNRREEPAPAGLPRRCHDCADLALCGGGCLLRPAAAAANLEEEAAHETLA